jgi:DNA-directed RNA polymerase subunit RPC12/RpoP
VNEKVFVCSKCGAENSISELVEVEIAATEWRAITVVAEKDGKPAVGEVLESEIEDGSYNEPDRGFASVTGYHCAECENKSRSLAEAVILRREAECRTCGFSGDPAEHPEGCDGKLLGLDPPEVNPNQVSLEIAA